MTDLVLAIYIAFRKYHRRLQAHDQPITILWTNLVITVCDLIARGQPVGLVTLEDDQHRVSVSLSNSEHQFLAVSNGLGPLIYRVSPLEITNSL